LAFGTARACAVAIELEIVVIPTPGKVTGGDVAVGNPIQQVPNWRKGGAGRRCSPSSQNSWNQIEGPKLDQRFSRPPVRRRGPLERAMTILKWALIFFLVSVVAGILGFTGLSAASADIARFLFYVFVVIFLVLLILGLTIFRV
jgi:uncharacterized membrane protein YtjA (UPF0391 family)